MTYDEYTTWTATLKTPVQPYTRKQWDKLSESHKALLAFSARKAR